MSAFRFRFTFHHPLSGAFRFKEQSVPIRLGDSLDIVITARDAETLEDATRFHIEGRGFPDEESARAAGEQLKLRLRVLNSVLGLGLVIPSIDSQRAAVAAEVKERVYAETGCVIVDTIEGLGILSDDPNHFEHVAAGRGSVFPSNPAYVFDGLAMIWSMDMVFDERADDALQILNIAISEQSSRAKFLITYLALERMVDRLQRSEDAKALLKNIQDQVQNSQLHAQEKSSLVGSLGHLTEQSFKAALFDLLKRLTPPPIIFGAPAGDFLAQCVSVRNSIAHNANIDNNIDLTNLSNGLRHFVLSLIWTFNRIPNLSIEVPPSTVQLDSMVFRAI